MSFSILISLFNLVVMITQIKQIEKNLIHFILYKFHLGRAFIYKQTAGSILADYRTLLLIEEFQTINIYIHIIFLSPSAKYSF